MYLSDAIAVIARRWWVVLLGALVTVGVTGAVFSAVATQYQATGQILLLPPTARVTAEDPINPYLNLPDGLTLTAALLANHAAGLDTEAQLAAEGFEATYSVSVLPGTGPLISISVSGTDPQAALDQRDRLISIVTDRLAQLQSAEAVAPTQFIRARDVTSASEAEVLAGARLRAAAVVGVLGVFFTVTVTFAIDRLRTGRSRPAGAAQSSDAAGGQLVVLADSAHRPEPASSRPVARRIDDDEPAVPGAATTGRRTAPPISSRPRRMRPPVPGPSDAPPTNGKIGLGS